jgi:UDP-glucuronate 4-epimerase
MTVLVTGGAGFIGSHVIDQLLGLGHRVVCLDNFDTFYDPNIKRQNIAGAASNAGFTLIEGDLRDENTLASIFSARQIDAVIHLAARAGVRPSIVDPALYYDVNVRGTMNLLLAMRKAGVKRLVFASSSSVYGNNKKIPFSEADTVDFPISPYAATKKAGELLSYTFHHLDAINVYCLRFFTAYGPRQRPEMAIHKFVRRIMNGEPVTVFGDGGMQRDYTFVGDVAAGVIAALDRVSGYEIINIGNSQAVSLGDLVSVIERVVGRAAIVHHEPQPPGDVDITFADVHKAHRLLGYSPTTSIEEGVTRFVEWLKNPTRST